MLLWEGAVSRVILSSGLLAVVLTAFLWGGCISCPQFFMSPVSSGDCCDEAGKCKEPEGSSDSARDCETMPLEVQRQGHGTAFESVLIPGPAMTLRPELLRRAPGVALDIFPAAEHSPPDLQALHSTFLI